MVRREWMSGGVVRNGYLHPFMGTLRSERCAFEHVDAARGLVLIKNTDFSLQVSILE